MFALASLVLSLLVALVSISLHRNVWGFSVLRPLDFIFAGCCDDTIGYGGAAKFASAIEAEPRN